jgi:non-canonical (house-cleaning) NTP pyrophosphatase
VGTSFDELFHPAGGFPDPGPGAGNIGRLTGGILTRVDYGVQAVICAAVRILHPELYGSGS